jgi:hypothetical protein
MIKKGADLKGIMTETLIEIPMKRPEIGRFVAMIEKREREIPI